MMPITVSFERVVYMPAAFPQLATGKRGVLVTLLQGTGEKHGSHRRLEHARGRETGVWLPP
jgi:hypothetical protein